MKAVVLYIKRSKRMCETSLSQKKMALASDKSYHGAVLSRAELNVLSVEKV